MKHRSPIPAVVRAMHADACAYIVRNQNCDCGRDPLADFLAASDFDKGFAAGREAAAKAVTFDWCDDANRANGLRKCIRALLPPTDPTCARCGGKGRVRTAPAKDGASFMVPCPDCLKSETPPSIPPVSRQLAKAATERTTVPDDAWAARLAADSVAAGECETPLPFDDEDRMLLGTPLASMHHFKDGKVERMPMSTPPNPEAAPHPSGCYCDTCTLRNLAEKNPEATVCDHGVARPAVCRVCLFGIKAEAAPVCATCDGRGQVIDGADGYGWMSMCPTCRGGRP